MSTTYILIDLFYNLILPAGLVIIVLTQSFSFTEDKVWRETMQLISDIRLQMVLAFNLQMVYFYYKLSLPTSEGSTPDVIESEADEGAFDKDNDRFSITSPNAKTSLGYNSSF